jgi:folate-binding protein YgfZ
MSAYFALPDPGCVRIGGEDRRTFLQRQTTNHIDHLHAECGLLSVLTSPTGRILDVLMLLEDEDHILALTLPGRGASIGRYLRGRVFFMDKVVVNDESAAYAQLDIFGPVDTLLDRLGLPVLAETNAVAAGENGLRAIRLEPGFGLGYRLVAPVQMQSAIQAKLSAAGAACLSPEAYALRRVEAGLPSGNEWNEDYTPLETGLRMAVSDSKGCYTGQEVIARQITYDKVTRRVCGLRLSASVSAPAELAAADGSPAGRLTSAVVSSTLGRIGLGIVKRPYDTPGVTLRVGAAGSDCRAEVVELPFL